MCLDDVGMRLELDPDLRCLDETLRDGRMPGHPCLLQCLDRIGQLGLMVVDNIHEPHTARLDVVDFPTILYAVADLPEGYHRCLSPPKCAMQRPHPASGAVLVSGASRTPGSFRPCARHCQIWEWR